MLRQYKAILYRSVLKWRVRGWFGVPLKIGPCRLGHGHDILEYVGSYDGSGLGSSLYKRFPLEESRKPNMLVLRRWSVTTMLRVTYPTGSHTVSAYSMTRWTKVLNNLGIDLTNDSKSLIYTRNNTGLRTVPDDTPDMTEVMSEDSPLTTTSGVEEGFYQMQGLSFDTTMIQFQ